MNLGEYLLQIHDPSAWRAGLIRKPPQRIRVDDRGQHDTHPDFCEIEVIIPAPESKEFELVLRNVPYDSDVEDLAEELNGRWTGDPPKRTLVLPLHLRSGKDIRRLARTIRKVRGRGKRYDNPQWRWVIDRTEGSLKEFADALDKYRRQNARDWRPEEPESDPDDSWGDEPEEWAT